MRSVQEAGSKGWCGEMESVRERKITLNFSLLHHGIYSLGSYIFIIKISFSNFCLFLFNSFLFFVLLDAHDLFIVVNSSTLTIQY